MTIALWLAAAYLLGAVPTSYWVARLAGIDLRRFGSRNLGATNLYRAMGWKAAAPAGLFDVAKGVIPVLLFAPRAGPAPWLPMALGTAAVSGHVFSLFVGFKGGKGVATAAGVLIVLAPIPFLISAGVWFTTLRLTGFMSAASLIAAATFPLATALLGPDDPFTLTAAVVLAGFIMFTHRANIQRLLHGTEPRFGSHGAAS
ncbi:MAG TPA: glycerol-3-phosphate 1-O-acyltransferase PlsY [Gemmatimonadales bacterium]